VGVADPEGVPDGVMLALFSGLAVGEGDSEVEANWLRLMDGLA